MSIKIIRSTSTINNQKQCRVDILIEGKPYFTQSVVPSYETHGPKAETTAHLICLEKLKSDFEQLLEAVNQKIKVVEKERGKK
jgi:hypothetical protein